MLKANLQIDLGRRLQERAERDGRSADEYLNEAVRRFLEDREDYDLGMDSLAEGGRNFSPEEVRRELGLER